MIYAQLLKERIRMVSNTLNTTKEGTIENIRCRNSLQELMMYRLKYYGKITREDLHRTLGNYFGYPKCCIDNYIELVNQELLPAKYMTETYCMGRRSGVQYVQCLRCLIASKGGETHV